MGIIFTGSRHSIRPSLNLDFANSKALDPRITFTRGSNATYYDGYTSVKAEENLERYSHAFDNSDWTKSGTTVTSNSTTAPDGTTSADTLTENTATANHAIWDTQNYVSGKIYVHSIFVKANGRTKVYLQPYTVSSITQIEYDLTAVTSTVISGTAISHNITAVGNSWYRISVIFTATNSGLGYIQLDLIDGSGNRFYTGDGTSGVYLWGAQVEQRDSLTAYTATSGIAITKYQPALQTAGNNVARFDHNPTTGESLGLLIEESRTNLSTYSEDVVNWYTTEAYSTLKSNVAIAPDGTLTADRVIKDNANANSYVGKSFSLTTGSSYTASVYVKKYQSSSSLNYVAITNEANSVNTAWFNLDTATVGTVRGTNASATITDVGNGWYRISYTWEQTSTGTKVIYHRISTADDSTVSTGNGFDGYLVWGFQLEVGSFPTSYIKTTGSQVTRSADSASMTGTNFSDWFNQQESTIYTELAPLITGAENLDSNGIWQLVEGPEIGSSVYGNITLAFYQGGGRIRLLNWREDGSSDTIYPSQTYNKDDRIKVVTAFKDSDASLGANGILSTGANWRIITTPKVKFQIGLYAGSNIYNGAIKKIAYYPKFLTDNEVTDLSEE